MVTPSKTGLGAKGVQLSATTSELDPLDKELGKDKVRDVLGDYLNETETAVRDLICANQGSPEVSPRKQWM